MTSPEAGNVMFTFAVNGSVHSTALPEAIGSSIFNEVDAYIAIFDAALGVNSATWYDRSVGATDDSLGKARLTAKFNYPLVPVDEFIGQVLSVSVPIVAGINKFDIFANLGLTAENNSNPIEITLDFSHTATFGMALPTGASYTSASGAFLTGAPPAPVPLPAIAPLLIAALGLLARRRA